MIMRRRGLGECKASEGCFGVDAVDCLLPVASAGEGLPCIAPRFPWVGLGKQDCCDTSGWFTLAVAGLAGFLVVRAVSR